MTNKKKSTISPTIIDEGSKVVYEGPISKFLNKNNTLVKRYLVLNSHGLFIYKDDIAFKSFPQKPAVVIPMDEIKSVQQREFSAHQILRNTHRPIFRDNENVFVMEIDLKRVYNKIIPTIKNFNYAQSDAANK